MSRTTLRRQRWAEVELRATRLRFTRWGKPTIYGLAILPSLLVLAPVLDAYRFVLLPGGLILVTLLLWRDGVTIDLAAGTIRCWSGPLFGLTSTVYGLSEYETVSLMEDSVEVFNGRGRGLTSERRYASSLGLKLQARLTPDMRHPEDLPPPLTLRTFGMGREVKARAQGEALALTLGYEFRSDV